MEQPAGADHVAPDPAAATGGGRGAFPLILALGIAAVFAAILLGTIDFPARTHADELSKVQAIITLKNSYAHPVLMLELVRAANALAGLTNPQAVAELGRAIAVLVGAAAVFVTFLLAREMLPAPAALAHPQWRDTLGDEHLQLDLSARRCDRRPFAVAQAHLFGERR